MKIARFTSSRRRGPWAGASLHFRIRSRSEQHVLDTLHDRPVALGFCALLQPFRIDHERAPLLFALGHVLPFDQVVELVVVGSDQHRPEARLTDAVLFPQLERDGLEALVQIGQTPGYGVIDAKLVDHCSLLPSFLLANSEYDYGRAVSRPLSRAVAYNDGM